MTGEVSRRAVLRGGASAALGLTATRLLGTWGTGIAAAETASPLRPPGSLPHPHLRPGTETMPQIEHIIVVMMENHSFDNYLGMLNRGDGFTLRDDKPINTNPDGRGNLVRAFHMAATCQPVSVGPSQSWDHSHISWDHGRNDGFVEASGDIAMGYWTHRDLPFYYAMARTFPLCDRWFCSVLAQTYPNRRFLLAGTAAGLIATDPAQILNGPEPPNGSIFERLNDHKIPWRDYASDLPQVALFPSIFKADRGNVVDISHYFADAAAGSLPAVSFVDPASLVTNGSEEHGDIHIGEDFVSRVVNAAMQGPGWPKTLLIWTYDEHGGYYDHVPPPRAVKPDNIPPEITVPPNQPGAYDRYGFRVPAVIASPYARKDYVSHVVHDHTSILKLIETKWNLPALTFRDANADDLLDSLDLDDRPPFLEPPDFPKSALAMGATCVPIPPSEIPPPGAVRPEREHRDD